MKIRIFLKSFNKELIHLAANQIRSVLLNETCIIKGLVSLPIKIKRFCVLRSPHIDKDSREHFEIRLYKCFIDLETTSSSIFNKLLKIEIPTQINCSLKILE